MVAATNSERVSIPNVERVRRRPGTKERRIGLSIQLCDNCLRLVLRNLRVHFFGKRDIIGAIEGHNEVRDHGTQDNLSGLRIKPPVKLRVRSGNRLNSPPSVLMTRQYATILVRSLATA
jgi:hypothetical protein